MEFSLRTPAPFAPEALFEAHRDELGAIVRRLPEVRGIDELAREAAGPDQTRVHNRWHGSPAALPLLLRPVVAERHLVWEDDSCFDASALCCTWQIAIPRLGAVADVRGCYRYAADAGGCTIHLDGRFELHPERAPEMRLPAGATPIVERLVVAMVLPMLERSGDAIVAHVRARER